MVKSAIAMVIIILVMTDPNSLVPAWQPRKRIEMRGPRNARGERRHGRHRRAELRFTMAGLRTSMTGLRTTMTGLRPTKNGLRPILFSGQSLLTDQ